MGDRVIMSLAGVAWRNALAHDTVRRTYGRRTGVLDKIFLSDASSHNVSLDIGKGLFWKDVPKVVRINQVIRHHSTEEEPHTTFCNMSHCVRAAGVSRKP
jgi:hypothetical protein